MEHVRRRLWLDDDGGPVIANEREGAADHHISTLRTEAIGWHIPSTNGEVRDEVAGVVGHHR